MITFCSEEWNKKSDIQWVTGQMSLWNSFIKTNLHLWLLCRVILFTEHPYVSNTRGIQERWSGIRCGLCVCSDLRESNCSNISRRLFKSSCELKISFELKECSTSEADDSLWVIRSLFLSLIDSIIPICQVCECDSRIIWANCSHIFIHESNFTSSGN